MHVQSDLSEWRVIPTIQLKSNGNLTVYTAETRQFQLETDDEDPHVVIDESEITVKSHDDLTVYVPAHSQLAIKAQGDATIEAAQCRLSVEKVGGNLTIESVGDVEVRTVGGNLKVTEAQNLFCDRSGGNIHLLKVHQKVAANAGGDLHVGDCVELSGNAGGEVSCQISPHTVRVQVRAGGDINCHLQENVNAQVKVICGGELLVLGTHSQSRARGHGVHAFTVGHGGVEVSLIAGGDVHMDGAVEVDNMHSIGDEFGREMGRFGEEMGRLGEELGREFGSLGSRIADRINRKVQQKVEKGMRRASAKAGKHGSFAFGFQVPEPPVPPTPPRKPGSHSEPVSDEERMMILRMLENGKISASEAETLLAALEGDHQDS